MIPVEIIEIIESPEFEENGEILIIGISFILNNCRLEISFNFFDKNISDQLWEIQIRNIREKKVCYEWFLDIQLKIKHKLLDPYLEINKELYIKSKPKSPNNLLKNLYVHHRNTFGNYREIEKFFNTKNNLHKLCEMDFGLFAKGPETYMNEYKRILEKEETQPYLFGASKLEKGSGIRWIEDNKNPKLLLCGESFFIADEFKFEKILTTKFI